MLPHSIRVTFRIKVPHTRIVGEWEIEYRDASVHVCDATWEDLEGGGWHVGWDLAGLACGFCREEEKGKGLRGLSRLRLYNSELG